MFIKKIVKQSIGAKMFSVSFVKADNTNRTMLCKLPTNEKFFSGGELLGNREHLLEVIDVNILKKNKDNPRKAWRSINLNTITSLKIGGIEWVK
tara:strand:- start:2600 stop:2881 length:282 start_codon:yes stop_codon:yes gene_type:complete